MVPANDRSERIVATHYIFEFQLLRAVDSLLQATASSEPSYKPSYTKCIDPCIDSTTKAFIVSYDPLKCTVQPTHKKNKHIDPHIDCNHTRHKPPTREQAHRSTASTAPQTSKPLASILLRHRFETSKHNKPSKVLDAFQNGSELEGLQHHQLTVNGINNQPSWDGSSFQPTLLKD
jgi:hypothetical protein